MPLTPLQDWLTLELTRHVVRRRPPDLLLTHFLMVDAFQHEFGPGSPEARWALEHVDGLVATLLAELAAAWVARRPTDVVVLGDPRLRRRPTSRAAECRAARRRTSTDGRAGARSSPAQARVTANGGSAHVYVGAGRGAVDRAREVLAARPAWPRCSAPETFAELGLPAPGRTIRRRAISCCTPPRAGTSRATPRRSAPPAALAYRGTHGHRSERPAPARGLPRRRPLDRRRARGRACSISSTSRPRSRRSSACGWPPPSGPRAPSSAAAVSER